LAQTRRRNTAARIAQISREITLTEHHRRSRFAAPDRSGIAEYPVIAGVRNVKIARGIGHDSGRTAKTTGADPAPVAQTRGKAAELTEYQIGCAVRQRAVVFEDPVVARIRYVKVSGRVQRHRDRSAEGTRSDLKAVAVGGGEVAALAKNPICGRAADERRVVFEHPVVGSIRDVKVPLIIDGNTARKT
jgi:hypothetical protein